MDDNFNSYNNYNNNENNGSENNNTTNYNATNNSDSYGNKYDSYKADGYNNSQYRADYSYMNEKPKKVKKEKKPHKSSGVGKRIAVALLSGVLFGGAAAGSFYAVDTYIIKDDEAVETQTNADVAKLQETVASLEQAVLNGSNSGTASTTSMVVTDVTSVVDKVMPSMVAVSNVGTYTQQDWFGRTYTQETESAGSGIIVGESDTEYFIATNHHVIEGAKTLTVTLADQSTADAFVKGYDESMDIAVIAVLKENLTAETMAAIKVAELGDSDSLKIGEPAIAIGNALGYGQSVTTGVVSALDRDMTIDNTTYENLIQTSAAINPGNSGGALLNISGQVIGINSSKVGGDTIEGMGFAIPIDEVKDIIAEFSSRETRTKVAEDDKGYLGIQSSTQYDLTSLGYPAGVYVQKVYENSPAEAAGIYMGDIITKCDGQSVKSITELSEFLGYYKSGETVTLSVTRNVQGKLENLEIEVTLGSKAVFND